MSAKVANAAILEGEMVLFIFVCLCVYYMILVSYLILRTHTYTISGVLEYYATKKRESSVVAGLEVVPIVQEWMTHILFLEDQPTNQNRATSYCDKKCRVRHTTSIEKVRVLISNKVICNNFFSYISITSFPSRPVGEETTRVRYRCEGG